MTVHVDAIQIIKPEPDSHFRLLPCASCQGDNVAYVQYLDGETEPWCVRCFDCGNVVDKKSPCRHDAQIGWNKGGCYENRH